MNEEFVLEMYEEDEMDVVESYIKEEFGDFDNVFHEIVSPDIHVDICVIKPTEERNFYTLVTMGMGAHKMNTPKELENRDRAELCIYLPADWEINEEAEEWYWPMRWLKIMARLPINHDTWLGHLHSVPTGEALADNTELNGFILDAPDTISDGENICTLPNGEIVNFYAMVPLYETEMSFKVDNGGEETLERLEEICDDYLIVDVERECCVDEDEVFDGVMDTAHEHTNKIYEKELQIEDVLAGYNHIAIFLRWFIEQDMVDEGFVEAYPEVIEMVKEKHAEFDLRLFLHNEFNGRLFIYFFGADAYEFAMDCYDFDSDNHYPQMVDEHAVEYFGGEPEEMQTEEYLFVPYDEDYYNAMKKRLDKAYASFIENQA